MVLFAKQSLSFSGIMIEPYFAKFSAKIRVAIKYFSRMIRTCIATMTAEFARNGILGIILGF